MKHRPVQHVFLNYKNFVVTYAVQQNSEWTNCVKFCFEFPTPEPYAVTTLKYRVNFRIHHLIFCAKKNNKVEKFLRQQPDSLENVNRFILKSTIVTGDF